MWACSWMFSWAAIQTQADSAECYRRSQKTAKRKNAVGMVLIPLYRPEHRSIWRKWPEGERQEAARFRRGRKPLPKTFAKCEKRRIKAGSGRLFLWFLSFGRTKERNSAVGPRTDDCKQAVALLKSYSSSKVERICFGVMCRNGALGRLHFLELGK